MLLLLLTTFLNSVTTVFFKILLMQFMQNSHTKLEIFVITSNSCYYKYPVSKMTLDQRLSYRRNKIGTISEIKHRPSTFYRGWSNILKIKIYFGSTSFVLLE